MKRILLFAVLLVVLAHHCWAFEFGGGGGRDARAVRLLAQSAVAQPIYTVPGWTAAPLSEVALLSYTIPGGLLGNNGGIRIMPKLTATNSANSKAMKFKIGGVQLDSNPITTAQYATPTATLINRGTQSAQLYTYNMAYTTAQTFDLSVDQVFTVNGATTLETGFTPTTANMSGTGTVVTVTYTSHGLNSGEYIQAAGSSTAGYNADPVMITKISANQFTYPGTGTGTPATAPTIKRYSALTLEGYTIELLPGAN